MSEDKVTPGLASRREVWQYIAVDRADLPMPESINVGDGMIFMDFDTVSDLRAWLHAVTGVTKVKDREPTENGKLYSYYSFRDLLGYHGILTCHEDAPTETSAEPISDDRVQEIVDQLNGFVVHEYEGGTDLVNGRAVRVREIVGTDSNLDLAIEWALHEPEVKLTCGPDENGAEVELTDGTTIVWSPDVSSWEIAVSEDAEPIPAGA